MFALRVFHSIVRTSKWILLGGVCLIGLVGFVCPKVAAQPVGEWRALVNEFRGFSRQLVVVRGESEVYMMLDRGLAYYDAETEEYRVLTRVEGLSGSVSRFLAYDYKTDYVFLAYDNGIVDFFRRPDQLESYNDIFLNSRQTNKQINALHPANGLLYIATEFGIVVFDINRRETRASYLQIGTNAANQPVRNVAVFDGRVWAQTPTGLFSGPLNRNLADPANWRNEANRNGMVLNGSTVLMAAADSHFVLAGGGIALGYQNGVWDTVVNTAVSFLSTSGPNVSFITGGGDSWRFNPGYAYYAFGFSQLPLAHGLSLQGSLYGIVDVQQGLIVNYRGSLRYPSRRTIGNDITNEIAVGGNGDLFVVPNSKIFAQPGILEAYRYVAEQDTWQIFNFANLDTSSLFNSVYVDPRSNRAFLGSWDNGFTEIENGRFLRRNTNRNTTLRGELEVATGPLKVRIGGFDRDEFGSTWIAQIFQVNDPSARPFVYRDNQNRWYSFGRTDGSPDNRFVGVTRDANGYAWFLHVNQGIVVLDINSTPNVTTDDRRRFLSTGSAGLPSGATVNCLALDRDGNMWVGTSSGVVVFYNTREIFTPGANTNAVCPIYEGRCLLRDENVQAIGVDGGNRKWFATRNGVFYFSADGTQQLARYTTENSPLLSNNVYDVAISPVDGRVYFSTENGLIAYRGPATEPRDNNAQLEIFPSPLYTDYEGQVAIRNTTENAVVRISTAAGYLVTELRAAGGQAVWNGRDQQGKKLSSGVYVVGAITQDGKQVGTTRFVVVER